MKIPKVSQKENNNKLKLDGFVCIGFSPLAALLGRTFSSEHHAYPSHFTTRSIQMKRY